MAGIGFELRKYLERNTCIGTLQAYGYAGIIGAGPWVLSIIGIMLVGFFCVFQQVESEKILSFLVSTTWLMASSLISTGCILLLFVRFIADLIYKKQEGLILPNMIGLIVLTTVIYGIFASLVLWLLFPEQSHFYRILMVVNFIALCNIWLSVIFFSGMKQYKSILAAFFFGYTAVVFFSILFHNAGVEGLLTGLFLGHGTLLFFMLVIIFRTYPGLELMRFDFLKRKNLFLRLIFIGFFYNAGLWIDKILFWLNPATSYQIIGPLRASVIYDLPIFLAYLFIIPGMAVFIIRIETDFVEIHNRYYEAIKCGETLQKIEMYSRNMFGSVQNGLVQIIKVQSITSLIVFLIAPTAFEWFKISKWYLNLFFIDVIAVSFQVIVLSILNIFFYINRLTESLCVSLLLVFSNGFLTLLTLKFGPDLYGTGFCGSMLITMIVGYFVLSRNFRKLEYYTFMVNA